MAPRQGCYVKRWCFTLNSHMVKEMERLQKVLSKERVV